MKRGFVRNDLLLTFIVLSILFSCQKKIEKEVEISFYHWKTTFDVSSFENDYLKSIAAKRIYLRFFDADWNGGAGEPLPIAELELENKKLKEGGSG